jgi:hypothetical protein
MTNAHEVMSLAHIARRLSEVRQGEAHLKLQLPVDSEYNRILRLKDILAYTGIPYEWVRRQFPDMWRMESIQPKPNRGAERPADKSHIEERQRDLSRFFFGWDQGTLIKARVGAEWRIIGRYQDASSLGAPARAPAPTGKMITMQIDRNTLGLRFK